MREITKTLELVRRAQAGDSEALNRIFVRYFKRVRKVIRVRMGPRLRERCDSDDVIQRTFEIAVRKFDDFEMRNEAALINWLSKIAEHQIKGMAKKFDAIKRNPDREVSLDALRDRDDGQHVDFPDDGQTPTELVTIREEDEILELALEQLDPMHRELIVLRNYVGLGWAAVAEELGLPSADAARMQHGTALTKLVVAVRAVRGGDVGP